MLFNSIDFAIFLPIVFALYWICGRYRVIQNIILLVASYVFYGWWDWRFLILMTISAGIDYVAGIWLDRESHATKRKWILGFSLAANLGILCFFKYFNFFVDSFVDAFSFFGISLVAPSLSIILPVGISFYTFQSMSYTIDIYRKQLSATKNPVDFFAFVSFFPQLVAGPIERAKSLLPQFERDRKFSYEDGIDGVKQIAWGLFKKVAVADTLAIVVDQVFAAPEHFNSTALAFAAVFFSVQVYADFSGYSDIALGTAKLFGFRLMINFRYPFFATTIAEFWHRWHISLITWFRDYVYYPLGGSRTTLLKHIRNIAIVFLLSGLWHGAGWTFVIWGAIHALAYILFIIAGKKVRLPRIAGWFLTMNLFIFSMIFFRAESATQAIGFIQRLFQGNFGLVPYTYLLALFPMLVMFIYEWMHRTKEHPLQLGIRNSIVRFIIYFIIVYLTLMRIDHVGHEFIYFQF